jgi:hypothetical protein
MNTGPNIVPFQIRVHSRKRAGHYEHLPYFTSNILLDCNISRQNSQGGIGLGPMVSFPGQNVLGRRKAREEGEVVFGVRNPLEEIQLKASALIPAGHRATLRWLMVTTGR